MRDEGQTLGRDVRLVRRQREHVRGVLSYLVTVHAAFALPGDEKCAGVFVVEGDEDGGRHIQGLGVDTNQVPGLINHDLSLGLSTEARHHQILPVAGPDHPGSLLGHNIAALSDRLAGVPGVEDPHPPVPADGGEVAATRGPAQTVDLLSVSLQHHGTVSFTQWGLGKLAMTNQAGRNL